MGTKLLLCTSQSNPMIVREWPGCFKEFSSQLTMEQHVEIVHAFYKVQCPISGCTYFSEDPETVTEHIIKSASPFQLRGISHYRIRLDIIWKAFETASLFGEEDQGGIDPQVNFPPSNPRLTPAAPSAMRTAASSWTPGIPSSRSRRPHHLAGRSPPRSYDPRLDPNASFLPRPLTRYTAWSAGLLPCHGTRVNTRSCSQLHGDWLWPGEAGPASAKIGSSASTTTSAIQEAHFVHERLLRPRLSDGYGAERQHGSFGMPFQLAELVRRNWAPWKEGYNQYAQIFARQGQARNAK